MIRSVQQGKGVSVDDRILELQDAFNSLLHALTTPRTSVPAKLYEGQLVFADGTVWNPGNGRGLYQYVSGAWVKL